MDPYVSAPVEGMDDNDFDAGPITLGGRGRTSGCVEDEGGGGKLKLDPVGVTEDVDIMAIGVRLEGRGVCELEAGEDVKVEPGLGPVLIKDD